MTNGTEDGIFRKRELCLSAEILSMGIYSAISFMYNPTGGFWGSPSYLIFCISGKCSAIILTLLNAGHLVLPKQR